MYYYYSINLLDSFNIVRLKTFFLLWNILHLQCINYFLPMIIYGTRYMKCKYHFILSTAYLTTILTCYIHWFDHFGRVWHTITCFDKLWDISWVFSKLGIQLFHNFTWCSSYSYSIKWIIASTYWMASTITPFLYALNTKTCHI